MHCKGLCLAKQCSSCSNSIPNQSLLLNRKIKKSNVVYHDLCSYWQRYTLLQWSKHYHVLHDSYWFMESLKTWSFEELQKSLAWHDTHHWFSDQLLIKPHFDLFLPQYQGQRKCFFRRASWKGIAWHMYASIVVGLPLRTTNLSTRITSICGKLIVLLSSLQLDMVSCMGCFWKVHDSIEKILNSIIREIHVKCNVVLLIVVSLMKFIAN